MSGLTLEKFQSHRTFLIYAHLREIVHIFIDVPGQTLRSIAIVAILYCLDLKIEIPQGFFFLGLLLFIFISVRFE